MNNKIIEVLDYLGEKIGLAIDWSANNVYPQVMEFLARYRTYEIVTDAIFIVLSLAFVFFYIRFIVKGLYPDYILCKTEKKDTKFFEWFGAGYSCDMSITAIVILVVGGIISAVLIGGAVYDIADIARWIFIPEAQFYHMIAGLMQ